MIENVVIMGAAGRDFHNFNVYFRNNPRYRVVGFTAAQIPSIENRVYPPELAGEAYPSGIPIYAEGQLISLIRANKVDLVAFSYSDIAHVEVMHRASAALAEGADFIMLGATYTMIRSAKPVVAVCAVRTGCGKSPTTREVCRILKNMNKKPVVVRHPMPYGDLRRQVVQRFAEFRDFEIHGCTIEEREEYEPLVAAGVVVYAGVDYEKILRQAETEADIIVWDGGNNDTPFYHPDIHVVVFDPHRPGHELLYHPGETNLRMAHVAVINKVDSARPEDVETVRQNIEAARPEADIVTARSELLVDRPEAIEGRRVLVIEDGPTLTHGGMSFGAGFLAAQRHGAAEIVDPRSAAVGTIEAVYQKFPHLGPVLPAMGYTPDQMRDLSETIRKADCDVVIYATPINLPRLIPIDKPLVRVQYEYRDHGRPTLAEVLIRRLQGSPS